MSKKKGAASSGVSQVEKTIKDIRARQKALLKRANLNVREYRKELATLKKQGVVSKRINAARHHPTRYMLGKVKQFKSVALGHELAIPLQKLSSHRARQYTERGIAERIGKFLVIPKTAAKQKADVYKGHIEVTTELKRGDERVIKTGQRLEDMHDILAWLEENEGYVNELKGSRGQLGFQLSGHNSRVGLANVKELISYLMKYDGSDPRLRGNIFNGSSKEVAKEFVIIRFRPAPDGLSHPTMDPYYGIKRYSKSRQKDRKDARRGEQYKQENARKRKASQRLAEDNEAYQNRLEKQRKRDRSNANTRREKRMGRKLFPEF